jgi:hypothetical protein
MDELEIFKRRVDLPKYAEKEGYSVDKSESSASSIVMRNEAINDKIIIRKGPEGKWQYFSVTRQNDSGSVIDFVKNKNDFNLGQTRRALRHWLKTGDGIASESTAILTSNSIEKK